MTLGELKIACLKLLDNSDEEYFTDDESIKEYESDSENGAILKNCFLSIQRALSRVMVERKIPYKSVIFPINSSTNCYIAKDGSLYYDIELTNQIVVVDNSLYYVVLEKKMYLYRDNKYHDVTISYNLEEIISDYYKMHSTGIISPYGAFYQQTMQMIGNGKIIVPANILGSLVITYVPNILLSKNDNTEEVNVPDEIANIIPYFVKGDIYEEEEAELSLVARNYFETCLAQINSNEDMAINSRVETVNTFY